LANTDHISGRPVVVYIPGLKPKPPPQLHREQLLRCLVAGVRRLDPELADRLAEPEAFELVSWTYDFYGEYRDIDQDLADIDAVVAAESASERDILAATSWRRRFSVSLFQVADYLPFLLPAVATEEIEVHLRDFFRYVNDTDGHAEDARNKLKRVLRQSTARRRPVLLLAHSMGSVIAYEALWQLSRVEDSNARVDLLVTSGSPLGQKIVQRHLLGRNKRGAERYPSNIGDWINIAALGELTAIDRRLARDYAAMPRLGLVRGIRDYEVFNYYYMDGVLNVHAEYGYLVNEVTARCVRDWWREVADDR
jgi:hypothetical protein